MPSANLNPDGEICAVMDGSKKWVAPVLGALGLLCATAIGAAASATSPLAEDSGRVAGRILATHNAERARLGLPQLRWSVRLEREARGWAQTLSRKGMFQHAEQDDAGENLWMGTAGHWPVEAMVGSFLGEKANFRRGRFPDISRTGNWYDAGHYSQIVWRDTREVGCAVASGQGNDVLVCRYWPAGNVWGESPY